jgi:aspartate beta-hydroxylase
MSDASSSRAMELVRAAELATQAGRQDEAAHLWARLLESSPEHPRALFALGERALRGGDLERARDLLRRAVASAPNEPGILLNLAIVERSRGDFRSELAALDRALVLSESLLPALLMKGAALERLGHPRRAAKVYRTALAVAPDQGLANDIMQALAHAREVVDSQTRELEAYLAQRLRPLRKRRADCGLQRFDEALGIATGTKKVYTPKPADFLFPQLPAVAYHDEANFPWLANLESRADVLRAELQNLISTEAEEFAPYVQRPPSMPVQQWGELNHSTRWSAYFLWKDGKRNDDHCIRCPLTASVLDSMPMADMPDFAPTAFFSSLDPGARIPPHTGSTNVRLIVHMPLIVPPDCSFRVGNETRVWEYGKAWVFDDTIEHEAVNGSDRQRVILIFDIWNPALTEAERELVCELQRGLYDYFAAG